MFDRIRSIIIMQVLIAALGWGVLWFTSPFSEGISDQIANLPVDTHENLAKQIAYHTSKRQLKETDEQEVLEQLKLLHVSLDWSCLNQPVFYPRIGTDGIVPVDMKWKCGGDLLLLPVYIEGLSRMQAHGILQSMNIDFSKKEMEFQLRFLRAEPKPPDWSSAAEDLTPKEMALLRQGWLLMYWKEFQKKLKEREESFDQPSFMIELSRVLTQGRNTKSRVEWSQGKGFTKRNF